MAENEDPHITSSRKDALCYLLLIHLKQLESYGRSTKGALDEPNSEQINIIRITLKDPWFNRLHGWSLCHIYFEMSTRQIIMNNILEGAVGFPLMMYIIACSSIKYPYLEAMGKALVSRHLSHLRQGEIVNRDRAWSILVSRSTKYDFQKHLNHRYSQLKPLGEILFVEDYSLAVAAKYLKMSKKPLHTDKFVDTLLDTISAHLQTENSCSVLLNGKGWMALDELFEKD